MARTERVTVTLPREVVQEVDRREQNRSRFVLDAIRHELARRRREDLRRSIEHPHQDSADFTDAGFDAWARSLPEDDAGHLVDLAAGRPLRWVPGEGWAEAHLMSRKDGPGLRIRHRRDTR